MILVHNKERREGRRRRVEEKMKGQFQCDDVNC